jgi:putative copper resistance protein D
VNRRPTLAVLAFDWRVNILFLAMAIAGIGLYGFGVVRLRRRGDAWPVLNSIAWLSGWVVAVLTTSSGLGRYSGAVFSLHMLLHMSLNMLVPLLLVLGGPVTLALRATHARPPREPAGLHEWITAAMNSRLAHFIFHPLHAFVVFMGSYYVLYLTDLFDRAMRYHWAHQLMNVDFLFVGYVFYSLVIGVDRPPRPLPHIAKLGLLLAAMPFHAFFGVIVMTSNTVIAQTFFHYLQAPWRPNLLSDQYLGGEIAWVTGEIPLIIVVLTLMVQWSRDDERIATRTDRHLDTGRDDSYDAYNTMLTQLAARAPAADRSQPAEQSTVTGQGDA